MRKENKLRPYRIDYFDVTEMKDNDLALVRSAIIRSTTCDDAVYALLDAPGFDFFHGHEYPSLVVIRSYRFYKKLVHKLDVFKAVEDLFSANMAVKVMEQVEGYRAKVAVEGGVRRSAVVTLPPTGTVDAVAAAAALLFDPTGHDTRYSDSSLYDEVCKNCGATDADGDKLDQPCPTQGALDIGTTPAAPTSVAVAAPVVLAPTTGPDSPATIAVVADMQGMLSHDAHEQAMDTFVPQIDTSTTTPRLQAAVGTKEPFTVRTGDGILGTLDPSSTNAARIAQAKNAPIIDETKDYLPGCSMSTTAPSECHCSFFAPQTDEAYKAHLVQVHNQTLIEPDQAVGCSARPPFAAKSNATNLRVENFKVGTELGIKIVCFGVAVAAILALVYNLLHH